MRYALATAALVAAIAGCGNSVTAPGTSTSSSSGAMACAPGQQIACACSGGGQGVQDCNAAGDAYGRCVCGGAGGSGGTGGTAMACTPGAQTACYDGPAGTENVGVCKAGQRTCLPDGSAYGLCSGQVLPSPDLCSTAADDDCDGSPTPCVQDASWCHAFPSQTSGVYPLGVAVDGAKNVYFGFMAAGVDLGNGPLDGPALVKYDPEGDVLWSKALSSWVPTAFTAATDGSVLLAGIFTGATDFGAGVLTCPGTTFCPCLVKLAPDGSVVFSNAYFPQDEVPGGMSYAIGVDGAGNVLIGGMLQNTFECGPSTIQTNGQDGFVAKLSPTGTCLWARKVGGQPMGSVSGLDVDGSGNILVSGCFMGSMSLGGAPLTAPDGDSLFITKLDPSGNAVFSRALGGGCEAVSVAADPSGNVLVASTFHGALDLGGGAFTGSAAGAVFVAKLDGAGQHLWSNDYGGSGEAVFTVRPTPAGGAFVLGHFENLTDLGSGPLQSAGGNDIFLAKYDTTGVGLSSRRYGDMSNQYAAQLAVNATGTPIISGAFEGVLDTGSGPIGTLGASSVFLCQIAE